MQATRTAGELRSGKGHKDENFPVASWVIEARHRGLILAFYEFVRVADDVADHATLTPAEKLDQLDRLERDLTGDGPGQPEAIRLRDALAARGMEPRHPLDVLRAFRMDVTKLRYADWNELMHYCTFSAMPVGRFVLDVHDEDRATWIASDALCAALQINNHLQDCRDDFRNLDRVYIPHDALAGAGASVAEIGAERASPALLRCLRGMTPAVEALLDDAERLGRDVRNARLSLEISVIQTYARRILGLLKTRDPLSERVHLTPAAMMGLGFAGLAKGVWRRATRKSRPGEHRSGRMI